MFGSLRSLSEHSPFDRARNTTLYYYNPGNHLPTVKELLNDDSIDDSQFHPIARAVLQVCCCYFCRVSEVLSLQVQNVFEPDRVICPGSKRGGAYVIVLPGLSSQIRNAEITDQSVSLFPISYTKCYRSFIRAGIRYSRPGRKNLGRSHSGRYQVNRLFQKGEKISVLSDLLRHRSKSSILYYIQK